MQVPLEASLARESKGIQSIEVGYKLLDALEHAAGPMSLSALAQATGMTASKCHFYLASFIRVGLMTQDGPGGLYGFGPSAIRLGLAALVHVDVLQLARQVMFELRDELKETVLLSIWGNHGPTVIYRVEGDHWSPWSVRVGTVLPYLSGTGRVLLAWQPTAAVRELLAGELRAAGENTIEFKEVEKTLTAVRKEGLAKGSGTTFPGYAGLAAPIFDHQGQVCAAITVIGNIKHFDRSFGGANAHALTRAAAKVGTQLGASTASSAPSTRR